MIQKASEIKQEKTSVSSRYWSLADGRVFSCAYVLDTETTPINEYRPDLVPQMVIAGAYDGQSVYFLTADAIGDFLNLHQDLTVVMHNASFDLTVMQQAVGDQIDVYTLVENNRVRDTFLLHRLVRLAVEGTAKWDESSLEDSAIAWLGVQMDKKRTDRTGRQIRLNFGLYLSAPRAIPKEYLDYIIDDVVTTFRLYESLNHQLTLLWNEILHSRPFGFVDRNHLHRMWSTHGPLTHHIQLKAAIVLSAITRNGFRVDLSELPAFREGLLKEGADIQEALLGYGYRPGEGSQTSLQIILRQAESNNVEVRFPRTETGKISTASECLESYRTTIPFIDLYLRHKTNEKLLGSFLNKMQKGILHPTFDVLKNTGRTSAFGDISSQNLPRDERIRDLFIPSPGCVFIDADYSAVEMVTLAQAMLSQFGGRSAMAEAINAGIDLHRLVASRLTGKLAEEITEEERRKAKAVNFGLPGGMGVTTLRGYAKTNYGIDLNESEAQRLMDTWSHTFPETKCFLDKTKTHGEEIARLLKVDCDAYSRATDQYKPLEAGKIEMLGWMARKVFNEESPQKNGGRSYSDAERDYFWTRLDAVAHRLNPKYHDSVRNRTASPALAAAVSSLAGQADVLTLTGRLRAAATYCARHNTIFQGLAADGTKLAMWKLWRNGFRIVNFIHDEFLIEVPEQANYTEAAETIKRLMI